MAFSLRNIWAIALFAILAGALWLGGLASGIAAIAMAVAAAALMTVTSVARKTETRPRTDNGGSARTALALLDSVGIPFFIVSDEGTILFASKEAVGNFDLVPGRGFFEVFRNPQFATAVSEVRATGTRRSFQYRESPPRERYFTVDVHPLETGGTMPAIPGQEDGEDLSGAVGVSFINITESIRTQKMRSDFIANVSHELRTPLSSIRGFIETIRGPARHDEAARDRFLGIMQEQAERMARLIDDLLSLSRIEMKSHLPPSGEVGANELVIAVSHELREVAQTAGVTLDTVLLPEECRIRGDRDELLSVMINLAENACKYGASGGKVELSVKLLGEPPRRSVRFAIRDFGPGIAPEHLPRLTERFYRVDVDESRKSKGTGLGLAIVKHILNRHGTRLHIESAIGHGSVFSFDMPLLQSTGKIEENTEKTTA